MADIRELLDIMARLRNPETGCAWDVKQTFSTIAPYTIEEAYEVADAIERNDLDDLRDELGDLLLQVVFHSRMAEEAGHFAFTEVVDSIVDKMIRRHPHVFNESDQDRPVYDSTESLKQAWEATKAEERAAKFSAKPEESGSVASALDGVAVSLPALTRAQKIQKRAARVGFDWQAVPPVLEKIDEELTEVREAINAAEVQQIDEEIGDLLFSVVNLARHCNIDPETSLRQSTLKFSRRFRDVEKMAVARSIDLKEQSLPVLDELWDAAKQSEQTENSGKS